MPVLGRWNDNSEDEDEPSWRRYDPSETESEVNSETENGPPS